MSQGPGAWPVCSKRAGLTRANGLAVPTTGTGTSAASRTATRTSPPGTGSIAVDGVWGAATNRKIEYVVASSNVNARIDGWESHRVQKKLGLAQHTSTVKSSAFAAHIQRKYGLTVTGTWNTATVKAFQKNLNYAR